MNKWKRFNRMTELGCARLRVSWLTIFTGKGTPRLSGD